MLKSEILVGSPRKHGNTFTLSRHLDDLLNGSNVESHILELYNYEIKPCLDCRGCKTGSYECVQKDQFQIIAEKLENADVIVFGTPIYWFAPTAKMKLLIDRLRPYFINKKLLGKRAALILCAGSGKPDCDLTIEMFNRVLNVLGIEFIGTVISKAYDLGDSAADTAALSNIGKLSGQIIQLIN